MSAPHMTINARIRTTPYTPRVEAAGVKGYSVYNHTLIPMVFRSLEDDYRHLKEHVQLWDVACQRQVELRGPDAARDCIAAALRAAHELRRSQNDP